MMIHNVVEPNPHENFYLVYSTPPPTFPVPASTALPDLIQRCEACFLLHFVFGLGRWWGMWCWVWDICCGSNKCAKTVTLRKVFMSFVSLFVLSLGFCVFPNDCRSKVLWLFSSRFFRFEFIDLNPRNEVTSPHIYHFPSPIALPNPPNPVHSPIRRASPRCAIWFFDF